VNSPLTVGGGGFGAEAAWAAEDMNDFCDQAYGTDRGN